MANSYSEFSELIEFKTEEQRDWFMSCILLGVDELPDGWDANDWEQQPDVVEALTVDEGIDGDAEIAADIRLSIALARELEEAGFELSDNPFGGVNVRQEKGDVPTVWVCSEEAGDLGAVASLVALMQRKYGIKEAWSATGSATCSKPRLGEFGGCACVVKDGVEHWINTWTWVESKLKELEG